MSSSTRDTPTVHVVGRGIVGSRLVRALAALPVMHHDARWRAVSGTSPGDVVVLAHGGEHADAAGALLARHLHVVTVGDSLAETSALLAHPKVTGASADRRTATNRHGENQRNEEERSDLSADSPGTSLVVGAAMSPGLSGLLARFLAEQLAVVDEIHVAIHGTAGPACARDHHQSLSGRSPSWRDGRWVDLVGGSGRELCWFPEPVGAKDCYRARIASPLVLHHSFPDAERISVRRSARRRDRFTAWLPMLRPPHPEGGVGALRVEVRGADHQGGRQVLIAGVAELVGTAAAATAAAFVSAIVDGEIRPGLVVAGDADLPTVGLLHRVETYGVRLQEFTGVPQPA